MSSSVWPALVGDIGGTNARFALVDGPGGLPARAQRLSADDYPTLPDAMDAYLVCMGARPQAACLAVAGPVIGDSVRFSNRGWSFSIAQMAARFSLSALSVINDFEALALSLPRLREDQLRRLGGGAGELGKPLALIGPGTGLGIAGLIPAGDRWLAVAGEGGHADLAPVEPLEIEVLRVLQRERGRASIESVLCGGGLERLARAVAEVTGRALAPRAGEVASAEEVTARALAPDAAVADPVCHQALTSFCALLGGAAGNLALTLGARGGVFIGGGIAPRIADFLAASPFRRRFEAKGRMTGYLQDVPTHLILADNPALTGAAARLDGFLAHP